MSTTTASIDAAFFEAIYGEAAGDTTRVPWAHGQPHPALVTWLNAVAPSLIRCGSRVAVVGCGLGDDAVELTHRGYDVTAFDVSPTAIEWARRRHPEIARDLHVADLFDLPSKWRHRFDLVVEIHTIQALPPDRRADTVRAIGELVAPHGHLLVICRHGEHGDDGPPFPLLQRELLQATSFAGLALEGDVSIFDDDDHDPPVSRMRALFSRV